MVFWRLSILDSQERELKTAAGEPPISSGSRTPPPQQPQATRVSRPPTPGAVLAGDSLAENFHARPGSRQARKRAATSHITDPARGGQQPISSRPAYSAFFSCFLFNRRSPMPIWVNYSSAGTGHSTSPSLSVHETWKIGLWSCGSVWVPGREGVVAGGALPSCPGCSYKLIELGFFPKSSML